MVAYAIWMQAAEELPSTRIVELDVFAFLKDWASREYTDAQRVRLVRKRFGLSRATTLLHVLSGGDYPICDARVRRAYKRLTGRPAPNRLDWYLNTYLKFFAAVSLECGTQNRRLVDQALFAYGSRNQ